MLRRAPLAILLCAILASGCTGSSGPHFSAVRPAAVAVKLADLPHQVHIGVLFSGTSPAGQGADVAGLAAGVIVAKYRLAAGGNGITLDLYDDHGSAAEALHGLASFVKSKVSGVVAATYGDHLDPMLKAAARQHLPVVLPYEQRDVAGATSSWYLAASAGAVASSLSALLVSQGMRAPYVLTGDGRQAEAVGLAAMSSAISSSAPIADQVAPVVKAAKAHQVDSVVVAASPQTQANVVAQLQGSVPDLRVVLSPEATRPMFGQVLSAQLAQDGTATTSGDFLSVGLPTVDATGLGKGSAAAAVGAFLSGLSLAAGIPSVKSMLLPKLSFSKSGAATADAASHDALLALVFAVQRARSADPEQVMAALSRLKVRTGEGLATTAALDFSSHRPVGRDQLVPLQSTAQASGQRAGIVEPLLPLSWFAIPASRS